MQDLELRHRSLYTKYIRYELNDNKKIHKEYYVSGNVNGDILIMWGQPQALFLYSVIITKNKAVYHGFCSLDINWAMSPRAVSELEVLLFIGLTIRQAIEKAHQICPVVRVYPRK